MTEHRFEIEDSRGAPANSPSGGELLPPVEPPSAGFIIQLFVIPALIVALIVALWLAFNWLVRSASRPEDVLKGLDEGPSIARWQRANELADMLRDERFADFKRDGKAADQVARTLDREIAAGEMDENKIAFRYYLTRALGSFDAQQGMDTLVKAAITNRDPREQKVRDGAIEAIAVRAYNLQRLKPPQSIENPDVEPTLLRLAEDEDPLIRKRAAYALGKIGSPAAIERLAVMSDDPNADTRYNAAIALAYRGNEKGVPVLAEMLDLEQLPSATAEKENSNLVLIRGALVHTAIEATLALRTENPAADTTPVIEALQAIASADAKTLERARLPAAAQFDAERALKQLESRTESTPPADKQADAPEA